MLERCNEASRHFEEALAVNEQMGARPWLAHTQADYSRTLFARGETALASELFATAVRPTAGWVWNATPKQASCSKIQPDRLMDREGH